MHLGAYPERHRLLGKLGGNSYTSSQMGSEKIE
jgi:hypothetical protein